MQDVMKYPWVRFGLGRLIIALSKEKYVVLIDGLGEW